MGYDIKSDESLQFDEDFDQHFGEFLDYKLKESKESAEDNDYEYVDFINEYFFVTHQDFNIEGLEMLLKFSQYINKDVLRDFVKTCEDVWSSEEGKEAIQGLDKEDFRRFKNVIKKLHNAAR